MPWGWAFPLAFVLLPHILFGLLTGHGEVIDQVQQYVGWLVPVLGIGAIAYMLDGYFLGLTAGKSAAQRYRAGDWYWVFASGFSSPGGA